MCDYCYKNALMIVIMLSENEYYCCVFRHVEWLVVSVEKIVYVQLVIRKCTHDCCKVERE